MKEYQFEFWKPRWTGSITVLVSLVLFAVGLVLAIALPVLISIAFQLSKISSIAIAAGSNFGFFYSILFFPPRKKNRLAELTVRNEMISFQISASGLVIKGPGKIIPWKEFKSYRLDSNSILFDTLILNLNGGEKLRFILQSFYVKQSDWREFTEFLIRMIKENNPDARRSYW